MQQIWRLHARACIVAQGHRKWGNPATVHLRAPAMKFGIAAKIFCAMLVMGAVALLVNGIAGKLLFERGFLGYLNGQGIERMEALLPNLQAEYVRHGSWEFVRGERKAWLRLIRPNLGNPVADEALLSTPPLSDQTGAVARFALLDAQGQRVIGNAEVDGDAIRRPIMVEGQTVGWLAMVPFQKVLARDEQRFMEDQVRRWWAICIVSVVVAGTLAWLLTRPLQRRIQGMGMATHHLAGGDYATRIVPGAEDELGRLAQDFNRMAGALEDSERNRREFMADISHELRTPLSVLRAELEAIQDGIRPMASESLLPLQGEVRQLGQLIDDLHELALTQSGELAYALGPLDLAAELRATAESMRARFINAGLHLVVQIPSCVLRVQGDERRLQQLFANLLENALRYTDRGGSVVLNAEPHAPWVRVVVEDSAPGVAADKRERLFERFYRVDASRNRASGGSGLGLSICRNIVLAHAGNIHAEASTLGGLSIVIELPLQA